MSVADNSFVSLISDEDGFGLPYWSGVEVLQERLLEQNERFINDIVFIRNKYGIEVEIQGDYSDYAYLQYMNNPPRLVSDENFLQDVRKIAAKIKLPGDWERAVVDYVFGIQSIGIGAFEYEKRAVGRVVEKNDEKYVEIRLYGDLTTIELREIIKSEGVRKLIKAANPTKKPYKVSDYVGFRVHQLRHRGLTYEQIWKQLTKEKHKYEDYHHIHKLHKRFEAKVDKLYA
jgi:hypothetical protein